MLHIVVRIYPQTLMTKTFFLWKLKGKIICQHGKQKLRKRNYTTCTFNLDSYSCLVKLRTLFPLVSCLLYQNLFILFISGIAEVMGSTPEQALAFFFLCFHYCFSGMSMTAKITLILKICFITNYLAWNITCSSEGRVALLSVTERWGVRTFFLLKRKGGPTFFFKKKKTKCEIIRSFISTVRS